MNDPTYDHAQINADPIWKLAFEMSERENDNAPLGWSTYIPLAKLAQESITKSKD